MHDEWRAQHQPLAALLDRRHQDAHGVFADARMQRRDLDAAEAAAAGGDDLGDRFRPGNQRQLPARLHDRASRLHPDLEEPVAHRMGLSLEAVRRLAIGSVVEGRIHDHVVEAVIRQTRRDTRLAGKRDIGLQHRDPRSKAGILSQQQAATGILRHDR
ncbi:hypothetical protein D9M72_457280 [compost metagenome]